MSTEDTPGADDARGGRGTDHAADGELSTRALGDRPGHLIADLVDDVALECGWGRVLFGQTFASHEQLVAEIGREEAGRRDVCLYVHEPHVLVSKAPQELFIDPSHTYRLWLHGDRPRSQDVPGLTVRELESESDAVAVDRLYSANGMVTAPTATLLANRRTNVFVYLVAVDEETDDVVGTVTGIDHRHAFNDPEDGSSLWCLAISPQTSRPGVGNALVRELADRLEARGRAYVDLSVMYDNAPAIRLYEQLGFVRVPVFCVKRKNPINERLFSARPADGIEDLNPYARIIADEALRRGITVEVVDAESGFLQLSHGGREVHTRESLSELTTAVAMSRCDDKRVTRRLLERTGLAIPRGIVATDGPEDVELLEELGELVVKPASGEQGRGVTVGVDTEEDLRRAIAEARACGTREVLLEECSRGRDLRVLVIGGEVVAAAVRRPPTVVGTGRHTVRELIEKASRRRAAVTEGEGSIPLDAATERTVARAGHALDDVLAESEELEVRRTANLHTGGTIHDVTERLHPELANAARRAAEVLDVPVVGIDLMVEEPDRPGYVIIEANERPGLANHEPQPTAERFVDLLFPGTRALPQGWQPGPQGSRATQP
jgi:GNAT-family acetyltransferase (TIGR03103 family)